MSSKAHAFLQAMDLGAEPAAPPAAAPVPGASKRRQRGKHIGGYFDRELVEKVALLKIRLDLENSELIERAINELYARESAAQAFGDR